MGARRFELHRHADVSGVSGVGVVADGVQYDEPFRVFWPDRTSALFPPGWCRVTWRGEYRSTVLWPSVMHLVAVNGHGGATSIVWLDAAEQVSEDPA